MAKRVAMRVAIAGGGNVGQSIARSLLDGGAQVLIIERERARYRPELVAGADWMLADACELSALESAGVSTAHVAIAATGDDKANLVYAMLCKTEFAVPRVVARINEPGNENLFGPMFGVDVAVSTPRTLAASVEQAVQRGGAVHLMTLQQGHGSVVEVAVIDGAPLVGCAVAEVPLPAGAALLGLTRDGELVAPAPHLALRAGDRLVLLVAVGGEDAVRDALGS